MKKHNLSSKAEFSLVVGDKTLSSWSMRAWLIAVASGVPFKEINIKLDQKNTTEKIKKYTTSGKVPVLLHNGITVWDTLAIAEYLHELAPEANLWPQDNSARAEARSYVAEMHSSFMGLRSQCSMDLSLKMDIKHLTPQTVSDIKRIIEIWDKALSKYKGPFLFGNFTIADAFYAPVVFRFISYGIKIKNKKIQKYMQNIKEHHGVLYWVEESKKEKIDTFVF